MKRFLSIPIVLAILLSLLIPAGAAADKQTAELKFNKDNGTYRIMQVSDTQEFIVSSTLAQEYLYETVALKKPDLIVLTGDNISSGGAGWGTKLMAKWMITYSINRLMKVFDRIYKDFGVPMTMVYGNHDNEVGEEMFSRAEQFAVYAKHDSFVGYYVDDADGKTKDHQGQHYGTHNLIIKDSEGKTPAANLWMFDSGSYDTYGGYSNVQTQQIEWFKAQNQATGSLPSLTFQHIIVPEIYDFLTPVAGISDGISSEEQAAKNVYQRTFVDADGKKYYKTISRDLPNGVEGVLCEAPCPGEFNYGQYAALSEAGNVLAMFFGHDHVNTFEVLRDDGPDLINSPCSAFGSYGDLETRGVRLITLDEKNLTTYETELYTYQEHYADSKLGTARFEMYNKNGVGGHFLDYISFLPAIGIVNVYNCVAGFVTGLFK